VNVVYLADKRLMPYRAEDLDDVENIIGELLSFSMIPDDLATKLTSFRNDVRQALEDRNQTR
jgi:hypothetical protein